MSLRPSYPDVSVGAGFVYVCPKTGAIFKHPTLVVLHKQVGDYAKANNLPFDSDSFDDNVCRNTPNIVCTESPRGAGDIVHTILNPIAKGADALLNTNLAGCNGCYGRQQRMNNK